MDSMSLPTTLEAATLEIKRAFPRLKRVERLVCANGLALPGSEVDLGLVIADCKEIPC